MCNQFLRATKPNSLAFNIVLMSNRYSLWNYIFSQSTATTFRFLVLKYVFHTTERDALCLVKNGQPPISVQTTPLVMHRFRLAAPLHYGSRYKSVTSRHEDGDLNNNNEWARGLSTGVKYRDVVFTSSLTLLRYCDIVQLVCVCVCDTVRYSHYVGPCPK